MNYWIEKTHVKGRVDREVGNRALGKALWSPQRDKRGADIYKNMREVKVGDVIIHLVDNLKFCGVSIVKESAIESTGISGSEWDGAAYLIQLEHFQKLNPEIPRDYILNESNRKTLDEINYNSEVFYNNKLELRQGAYLTPCPNDLMLLINNIYNKLSQTNLPHINTSNLSQKSDEENVSFQSYNFNQATKKTGLHYSPILLSRFVSSLLTKPFIILTGLSGSGKTKLAQAFVQWISQLEHQYRIVPVGADWTNREPLLGYPNALKPEEYIKPDNGVLDLIIRANDHPNLPHFLILDEMNLSHVERYFADFLSAMESKEPIPLHPYDHEISGVPKSITLPENLFIIGTVNIDETTNMFSPKVLDRANTIEFRINRNEIEHFLKNANSVDMKKLIGRGAAMAGSFLKMSKKTFTSNTFDENTQKTLVDFFTELSKTGAEFGYRSAYEISRLINQLTEIDTDGLLESDDKLDIAIMQKLLPKLHGSRRKLVPVLRTLASLCVKGISEDDIEKMVFQNAAFSLDDKEKIRFSLSLEKIIRMYNNAVDNGFASYAEA